MVRLKKEYVRRSLLRNHRRNKIKPLQPVLKLEVGFQDRVQISKREYFELLNENHALKEYKKESEQFIKNFSELFKTDYDILKQAQNVKVYEMYKPATFETLISIEFTINDYTKQRRLSK